MFLGILICSLKRGGQFAAVLGFFMMAGFSSQAASRNNFNLQSSDYPLTVVSDDPEYGGLVLDLLNRSFRHFASTTGIKTFADIRFQFFLEGKPAESNQDMETFYYPRKVSVGEEKLFKVEIPSSDFNAVALVRTAMICQIQAFVLNHQEAKPGDQLQAPPYWLMEGLTQGMLDKKTPSLEKIIARIDRVGPVPTLETVQEWKEVSPSRLEQWWQEACCYWLVLKTTSNPADRQALCSWLIDAPRRGGSPYLVESEENVKWWKKALGQRSVEKTPLKGEEWTRDELQRSLQFKATLKGEKQSKDFNLAQLPKPPLEFTSAKPFEEVMNRMMLLQARGNLLWQDVIESYRYAYAFWLKGKYADYQKEIASAEAKAQNVTEYMIKTRTYLDWYEVNNPASGPKFSALLRQSLAFQDTEALAKLDQAEIAARLTLIETGKDSGTAVEGR